MSIFKRIPVPLCAVALGMFGLGNLLQSYSEEVRLLCGAVAAVLLLLFLISVVVDFKKFLGEMKNPIMASVFCTFPMALMMLATYIKPYIGPPAKALWFVGIGLHVVLIVYFTLKFVLGFSLEKGIRQLVYRLCGHRHGRHHRPCLRWHGHRFGLCQIRPCRFGSAADPGHRTVPQKGRSRSRPSRSSASMPRPQACALRATSSRSHPSPFPC